MKKLVVIILNYNDAKDTIRITKEYEKMKVIDRIIVVDNASPDNSYEKLVKLQSNKVDVIKCEQNNGYSSGNNFGIKYLEDTYGDYKYICISNPDIFIDESSIKKCVDFLDKNKNTAICAPKMIMKNGEEHPLSGWKLRSIRGDLCDSSLTLQKKHPNFHYEMYSKEYMSQDIIKVDCVAGSFFIANNKAFKEVGYFDEKTFLYYEEDILGNKLKKLGYENYVLNTCTFKHMESVSVDKSFKSMKKYKMLQKSRIYYHKQYDENMNFLKLILFYLVTCLRYIEQFNISMRKKLSKIKFLRVIYRGLKKVKRIIKKIFILTKKGIRLIGKSILKIYKVLIYIIAIITLPIYKLKNNKHKVLYFSVVNWKWIKQRPHFVPLFLCDNGYKIDYLFEEPYDKYLPKQENLLVNNDHINENLTIKKWKYKPFHLKGSWVNRFRFVTRTLFLNYEKVIFTNPKQIDNFFMPILKLRGTEIFYECMDNYIYWEAPHKKNYFNGKESYLVKNAKKIIVSSEGLKKLIINKHKCDKNKIVLIRNGYDKEVFMNYNKSPLKMKHPNCVYIGTIDEWFDFDSIIKYANKHKDMYFYVIGPVGFTVKEKVECMNYDNIIFPGPIEHKYVPDTIKNSDVMLLPFLLNPLIEDVDPVKVYEYLYMKKPVVSSYWKELDQFENFVIFYKNKNEFEKAIDKAIKFKIEKTKEYDKLIFESAWEERLKDYLNAIK